MAFILSSQCLPHAGLSFVRSHHRSRSPQCVVLPSSGHWSSRSPDENAGMLPGGSSQRLASLSPVDWFWTGFHPSEHHVRLCFKVSSTPSEGILLPSMLPALCLLTGFHGGQRSLTQQRSPEGTAQLLLCWVSGERAFQCPSCCCIQLCLQDLKWPLLRRH